MESFNFESWTREIITRPKKKYSDPEEAFEARTIPEPNTGCLLWIGSVDGVGYGKIWKSGRYEGAHRYAWERVNGPIPEGREIDHICHTPQCVNVEHLRSATRMENRQNLPGAYRNSKSGYRGVYFHKPSQRWVASVKKNSKTVYYKTFASSEDAAKAVSEARARIFGRFAGGN